MDHVLPGTIAVVVVDRNNGAVDGQLLKVGAAMAVQLRVEVREDATLQQRVLSEVDTTNDVTGLELIRSVSPTINKTHKSDIP